MRRGFSQAHEDKPPIAFPSQTDDSLQQRCCCHDWFLSPHVFLSCLDSPMLSESRLHGAREHDGIDAGDAREVL